LAQGAEQYVKAFRLTQTSHGDYLALGFSVPTKRELIEFKSQVMKMDFVRNSLVNPGVTLPNVPAVKLANNENAVRIEQLLPQKDSIAIEIGAGMQKHRKRDGAIAQAMEHIRAGCRVVAPVGEYMIERLVELRGPDEGFRQHVRTLG
jgi:hypothetical protein